MIYCSKQFLVRIFVKHIFVWCCLGMITGQLHLHSVDLSLIDSIWGLEISMRNFTSFAVFAALHRLMCSFILLLWLCTLGKSLRLFLELMITFKLILRALFVLTWRMCIPRQQISSRLCIILCQ